MNMTNPKWQKIKNYAKYWRSLPPEIKPTSTVLKLWEPKIKKLAQNNKRLKALVLGATPEIRDLLAKYKVHTICLDVNPMMIAAMSLLTKKTNPREKIVRGSWLKMPFRKDSFDIIISDCPQDNLVYKDFLIMLQNAVRVLRVSGYWFWGTTHFPGFQRGISLKELIKAYRANPKLFKNRSWWFYYLLRASCNKQFYNPKNRILDWIKFDKVLAQMYKNKKITKQELDHLKVSTEKLGQSLACRVNWLKIEDFVKLLTRHKLYILAYIEDDILPAGSFRQGWILKKNK